MDLHIRESENRFSGIIAALEDLFDADTQVLTPGHSDRIDEVMDRCMADSRAVSKTLEDAARLIALPSHPLGNSHRHAHGFAKLSLYRSTRFAIRLHVWWAGEKAFDDSPHSHRWDFYSRLLSGSLRIRNFIESSMEPAMDAGRWHRYRYFDSDANGRKNVCADGQVSLGIASEYQLHAGSGHTLVHTEPHQVFGRPGEVAATIVVTLTPAREFSTVYHERALNADFYSFGALTLSRAAAASEVLRFVDSMAALRRAA